MRSGWLTPSARRSPGTLGPAEARVAAMGGLVVVALAAAALLWPHLVTVPLAALGLWLGAALLLHAARLARSARGAGERGRKERSERTGPGDSPDGRGST